MTGTTITTTLSTGVVVGSADYPGPVYIASSGGIAPSGYQGLTGIELPSGASNPTIVNSGSITGGANSYASGTAGIGIVIQAGTLINAGNVIGGAGVADYSLGQLSDGGAGILLQNGTIDNTGTVTGGSGAGYRGHYLSAMPGNGGVGIVVEAGSVTNSGEVRGGGGGYSMVYASSGGAGIVIHTGTLVNSGNVTGGSGSGGGRYFGAGGTGAAGVSAYTDVVLVNHGSITGGVGGFGVRGGFGNSANGVGLGAGAILTNYGLVAGGAGGDAEVRGEKGSGGKGGAAIYGSQSTIINHAAITGGAGGNDAEPNGAYFVTGNGGAGVQLSGGVLQNYGSITGGNGGDVVQQAYDNYSGSGGAGGAGIQLSENSTLTNFAGATVNGGNGGYGFSPGQSGGDGVILGASATAVNLGVIAAGDAGRDFSILTTGSSGGIGVMLDSGALLVNDSTTNAISGMVYTARIAGGDGGLSSYPMTAPAGGAGVWLTGAATLVNSGLITGGAGGAVYSPFGNAYTGGTGGAGVYSTGLVINSGTIEGGAGGAGATLGAEGDAVDGGTLIVDPGAVFIGDVNVTTLEVAGISAAALGGFGGQFTASNAIIFDAGSNWTLEGNIPGFADGQAIDGFTLGDTIVLENINVLSETYVSGIGLELGIGSTEETLAISGSFSTSSFLVTDFDNSTTITVTCFAEGTRIATACGEAPVETLKIGDLLRTQHAGLQPIKWIGRRSYGGRFLRGNKAALPIRIKAGAIADAVPSRDLFVSPGHAISIDNMLVHASRLVNGVTILQEDAADQVTYYHIELENHEILFAENCPAESFMDEHFRRQFQNVEEFHRLYPGQVAPRAMCQPRLDSGFVLQAILQRLNERAGIKTPAITGALRGYVDGTGPETCFGWAQDMAAPEAPVSLDILCGGRRIGRVLANLYREDVRGAGFGSGYQGFEFLLPSGLNGQIEIRRSIDGAALDMAMAAVKSGADLAA